MINVPATASTTPSLRPAARPVVPARPAGTEPREAVSRNGSPIADAEPAPAPDRVEAPRTVSPADSEEAILTQEELRQLRELRRRDQEVRAHELAHQAVGGRYAGAAEFEFVRGPDGVQYAVAGSVDIDVSPVPGDPAATIQKMRIVRAAALAPINPSPADRAVAAEAARQLIEARAELARGGDDGSSENATAGAGSARAARAYADIVALDPSRTVQSRSLTA
jgi:hypothetical protein